MSDIIIRTAGGGTVKDANNIFGEFSKEWFELQDKRRWPEYGYLGGTVPAYGIYPVSYTHLTLPTSDLV